jgi:hypothetical protein
MRVPLIAALGFVSLTSACAGNGSSGDDSGSYNCATETRADAFVVGLEKMGAQGKLDFKLLTADPAPPARDDNTWVIQVNAMSSGVVGSPITGASINVFPFMPDHQHGTPSEVFIEAMPEAGQYQLSPVNMWMPGLWETTINVTSASGTDKVVYRFCIPS